MTEQTYNAFRISLQLEAIQIFDKYEHVEHTSNGSVPVSFCEIHFEASNYLCSPLGGADKYKCTCSILRTTLVPSYNLTLVYLHYYHFGPPLSYLSEETRVNAFADKYAHYSFNTLGYTVFEQYLRLSDATIVNVGVHYDPLPIDIFNAIVRYLRDALAADMARSAGKRHLYRASFPVHPKINPMGCHEFSERHWSDTSAIGIIMGAVPVLDMYDLLKGIGKWHSKQEKHDCMHWCFSHELFYPFWDLLSAHVAKPLPPPRICKPFAYLTDPGQHF